MHKDIICHQLSYDEVFSIFESDVNGLTTEEARSRLEQYGYNELVLKGRSIFMRFLDQFRSPLIWILLVAAIVTTIMSALHLEDMWVDTGVILAVVIINVLLGFQQEGKAESALEALKKMVVAECTVLRDGVEQVILTRELVPGDVVILNGGDKIPADIRLFYTKDVHVDESPLTGESVPVSKNTEPLANPNLTPADRRNMVFSGTFITRGFARGIVVYTAEETEFGKIARLMKQTHIMQTPLQKKIAAFTKILVIGIIGLGVINFIIGVIFGQSLIYMFMASVALIVAGMPEMLPMIVTGVLALAATAMAKRNVLIRRLPAAETLGCTTVICSDKTGTLTKNEMTVLKVFSGQTDYKISGSGYDSRGELLNSDGSSIQDLPIELKETLKAGYICNNARLVREEDRNRIIGDPTEGALLVSATKAGIDVKTARLDEIPFDSELMYMATLQQEANNGNKIIYVKGSPERVLEMCDNQLLQGNNIPLDKKLFLDKVEEMASEALRVLGFAYKVVPAEKTALTADDMNALVFLGLQGMMDPPRDEVIDAVKKCRAAGIRPVMITGDHVLTAVAIARQIGIVNPGMDGALSGEEISLMSDEQLYRAAGEISVYARVAPEHKLRIAQQLQRRGEIVAMTGDGVNDAPALKAADIGIAMGISGTEVSKEASSMVLTDDNFASIVSAVEEGRHAWKNLQKAILYTLPTNGGQALLIMGAILLAPFVPLFAFKLPLEPIHILWINLADSVFLTMPLLFEPKDKRLLQEKPRDPKERIANKLFFIRVGLVSLVMAITGFFIYWHYGHFAMAADDVLLVQAQTATFMAVKLLHLGFIVTARSVMDSAFTFSPFTNKWVLYGIALTIITQLIITYVPFAQVVFKTAAFPVEWWPIVILALFPGFVVIELEKWIRSLIKNRAMTPVNAM